MLMQRNNAQDFAKILLKPLALENQTENKLLRQWKMKT